MIASRTMRRRAARLAGAGLLWTALAAGAAPELELSVVFDHGSYVLGEPVTGVVTLVNRSARPLIIDDYGEYIHNRLVFDIRTGPQRRSLTPLHGQSTIRSLMLVPGERESFPVNLARHYPLAQAGRYYVRARLQTRTRELDSGIQMFDIVPGLLLAETTMALPDRPDERRNLRVVYWPRHRGEWIFLRAQDAPSGVQWETLRLGSLVRIAPVTLKVDPTGLVRVSHQASRDIHVESIIESRAIGLRLLRQETMEDTTTTPLRRAFLDGSPPPPPPDKPLRRWWRRNR